jgi:hypothetical protein
MKKVKNRFFLLRQKIITLSATTFDLPTLIWYEIIVEMVRNGNGMNSYLLDQVRKVEMTCIETQSRESDTPRL